MRRLPIAPVDAHARLMFTVTEADAAAIRRAFHEEGELTAVIEVRQRFPGITENAEARDCARIIAGWRQPPPLERPETRLPPDRG